MAAGISQPGGAGTSIFLQDDTHADADLDGVLDLYAFRDVALKALASGDWVSLGTTPESYRGKATLQNGDGTGTAATTLKGTNETLIFDTGKTLAVSAVGSVNRKLEFGTKIVGANGKPSGKDGCRLIFGAATTLRGTVKLYACHLRQPTGTFAISPGTVGLPGEVINCNLEAGGAVALGVTTSELATVYNLDVSLLGTFGITQWNVLSAERITVATTTASAYFATGGTVRIRDLVMIGAPTLGDLQNNGANEWDLTEPIYSDGAPQVYNAVVYINEWWRWLPRVIDGDTGLPRASCSLRVLDKDLAEVLPVTYTDALGQITYGAADLVTKDCLKARRGIGGVGAFAWEERGPFTVRVNMDGTTLAGLDQFDYLFGWPRTAGAFGDLLRPVFDVIPLGPPPAPATPPTPVRVEDLPLVADGVERILAVIS